MTESPTTTDVLAEIRRTRVIPMIAIRDAEDAVPLARALAAGGLPCLEITFRTAQAAEAMRRITDELPDVLLGAGTVLSPQQVEDAKRAGARFVVSPGFNPAVVDRCLEHDIPVYPGVCTPTDIEAALAKGLQVLKFFPAEPIGGLRYLKAIAAPYRMVEFIPTGGIDPNTLPAYLEFPRVVACGGSWLAPAAWIDEQRFDEIRAAAEQAVDLARASLKELPA